MKREYCPRLIHGKRHRDKRSEVQLRLPKEVKQGLREIAASERKTMNWVMEQVIIDYFGLKQPKYVRKANGK